LMIKLFPLLRDLGGHRFKQAIHLITQIRRNKTVLIEIFLNFRL